jgi:hypothetical protein
MIIWMDVYSVATFTIFFYILVLLYERMIRAELFKYTCMVGESMFLIPDVHFADLTHALTGLN